MTDGTYQVKAYLENPNSTLDTAHIIDHIQWGPIAPQDVSGSELRGGKADNKFNYNTNPNGNTNQLWNMKSGGYIRIPQSLMTKDGKWHDIIVKLTTSGDHLLNDRITIWNQDGAINYGMTSDDLNTYNNVNNITAEYWVDSVDNHDKYLWINAEADLDGGQTLRVWNNDGGFSQLMSIGGGIHYASADGYVEASSNPDLGYRYGNNHTGIEELNGFKSTPDGVVVYAYYGSSLKKNLINVRDGHAVAVIDADFGVPVNVNVNLVPTTSVDFHYNKTTIFSVKTPVVPIVSRFSPKGMLVHFCQ